MIVRGTILANQHLVTSWTHFHLLWTYFDDVESTLHWPFNFSHNCSIMSICGCLMSWSQKDGCSFVQGRGAWGWRDD